jgi:hypothetical protein
MSYQIDIFATEEDAIFAAIISTMEAMRIYDDKNGYTSFMFGSLEKYNELDGYYQQWLDGQITRQDVFDIYYQNKDFIRGKWAESRQMLDGRWTLRIFNNNSKSGTTEWFDITKFEIPADE